MQSPDKTYAIHVPQGRIGRINKTTSTHLIDALHTDEFSTCIIICLIGKDKAVMIHADGMMINTIKENLVNQYQWLNKECEIIICYKAVGKIVLDLYLPRITEALPGVKITKELLAREAGQVVISLTTFAGLTGKNIHSNIQVLPISKIHARPDNLLHHPLEQQFTNVQKVEQVIGLRACVKLKAVHVRNHLIFSENHWIALGKHDLLVNTSHPLTQTEMKAFSKTDTFSVLVDKINQLVADIRKEKGIILGEVSAIDLAFELESYLHDVTTLDPEKLFVFNMKDFIQKNKHKARTTEDKQYIEKITEALSSENKQYEKTDELIKNYKLNPQESSFKKDLVNEFALYSEHFLNRQYYKKHQIKNSASKEMCKKLSANAVESFRKGEYLAALNLFSSMLNKIIHVYLDRDAELSSVYYSIGRCHFKLSNYEQAIKELAYCVALRIKYQAPASDIQKAQLALTECYSAQKSPQVQDAAKPKPSP